jgi:hypothetical protein
LWSSGWIRKLTGFKTGVCCKSNSASKGLGGDADCGRTYSQTQRTQKIAAGKLNLTLITHCLPPIKILNIFEDYICSKNIKIIDKVVSGKGCGFVGVFLTSTGLMKRSSDRR